MVTECKLVYHVRDSLENIQYRASNLLGESCFVINKHLTCYVIKKNKIHSICDYLPCYNQVFGKDKAARDKLTIDMWLTLKRFSYRAHVHNTMVMGTQVPAGNKDPGTKSLPVPALELEYSFILIIVLRLFS